MSSNGSTNGSTNGSAGKNGAPGVGTTTMQHTLNMDVESHALWPVRVYGGKRSHSVPRLSDLQLSSFSEFLQEETPPEHRTDVGLQAVLGEIFPIQSYDGTMELQFLSYELGSPRYSPEECRDLKITYGRPFKVRVRLQKEQPVEEEVYLGEIPIMVGGGEFIVNGTERVIVTQLHRSPGVDFSVETHSNERKLHSCWLIPERGSWIELNVTKKEILAVRIDQSGKFPATILLRAVSEEYSTDADLVRLFYETRKAKPGSRNFKRQVIGRYAVEQYADADTGEIMVDALEPISEDIAERLHQSGLDAVEVIADVDDPLILNTLREDTTESHEEALLKIYGRLRPGNPPQIEKARELFEEKFFDETRYRLGRVGRFRLNRKFGQKVKEDTQTLLPEDFINAIKYILSMRAGDGEIDDIDHLGNRRVRTIQELAG